MSYESKGEMRNVEKYQKLWEATLISDIPPDIQFTGNGQAFRRYTYPEETSR